MDITKKVDNLLEELLYCDFRTEVGIDKGKAKIRKALKVQDRDTRHACAESVAELPHKVLVNKDHAHAAIMNCRGGLVKENK